MSDEPTPASLPPDLARVVRMPAPRLTPEPAPDPGPRRRARRREPEREREREPAMAGGPPPTAEPPPPPFDDPPAPPEPEPEPPLSSLIEMPGDMLPAALAAVVSQPVAGGRRRRIRAAPEKATVPPVAALLPRDVCTLFGVRAVRRAGDQVTVAIADPEDLVARTVVEVRLRALGIEDVLFLPMYPVAPSLPVPVEGEPEVLVEAEPDAETGEAPAVPRTDTGRLGEQLLAAGLLSEDALADALARQEREGGRLGEILTHHNLVAQADVARVLAVQAGLPYVDAAALAVDPEVASWVPARVALRHRVLAWAEEEDGVVDVAVTDPFDAALRAQLLAHFGRVRLHVAADGDVRAALERAHAREHISVATSRLATETPLNSAATTFTRGQRITGLVVALVFLAGCVIAPVPTIVLFNVVAGAFYLASSIYKIILSRDSFHNDPVTPVTAEEVAALDEATLPVFTILMPMYREAAVVRKLVAGIARLDYPRHKLDVKLLLEEDDPETRAALERMDLPPHFHVITVPDALPKTKPKACNYGLLLARGEITVIYDAEDEPDPDQLKKVVVAFAKSDPSMVCVQCKLNYYNRTQNLLTRWFTTEYSQWFDIFLPGLDAHDVPIPLGGTSNHFVTEELVTLGAWDPYNVAEDADLGIRLNKNGWRTGVVDSTTYEEANPELHNWIRQRSRWIKGYMQTYLVHMRHPWRLLRTIGVRSFASFQLTVGGTFLGFLLNPVYWALTTLWLASEAGAIRTIFPGIVYYTAALGLFLGNFTFTYLNAIGSMRRGYYDLVKFALLSPIYWSLMSWAAWKGATQLITKPHYWEKTEHGLATERSH